jgi:hypothetical protein
MKKIKMALAGLAICGLLIANFSASGFQSGKVGEIGGGGGELTCYGVYEITGTTAFTKCYGCQEQTGSDPRVADKCTPG